MKQEDPKIVMLGHSEAKIALYGTYLATYLNILSRVPSIERIFVFDLFCGEGVYQDGSKGSPLIALDIIKNHYFANNQTCPNMTIWFNDNGLSELEDGIYKIERLKKFCSEMLVPSNVTLDFKGEDYDSILPKALNLAKSARYSKGLFFLDPYGYKNIKFGDIQNILQGGNTEVLLFQPIAYMYRFAKRALRSPFSGSKPLHDFLVDLFGNFQPSFKSVYDFISQIRDKYRERLGPQGIYVDTFTIERDSSNVYCLFFFTSHIKGFEKMLETKWKIDVNCGKGYILEKSLSFLNEVEISGYPDKLMQFVRSARHRTNIEIYRFGLENGFLPKHTNGVLKNWIERPEFEIFSIDGRPVKSSCTYIGNPDRLIGFRFIVCTKPLPTAVSREKRFDREE